MQYIGIDGCKSGWFYVARHYEASEAIIDKAMNDYLRKEVARDDIVDALIGAVTSQSMQKWATIPEMPETDVYGLPMERVYARL